MRWFFIGFIHLGLIVAFAAYAADPVSSNPGAVNITTGTGALGESLGFSKDSGVYLGGLLVEDINYLFCGGADPRKSSGNSLFILSLNLNSEKLNLWEGGSFGTEFLQFNGRPTNLQAGSVQGYNGLTERPPLDRSELFQLWIRQEFFCKKLIVRIGKSIPSYDFNNVVRPLPIGDNLQATTELIYTPIFINSTLLGVLPGYYNSAYGICLTYTPQDNFYINYGLYDGNLARGKQIGLRGPQFNAYRFQIAEAGYSWGQKSYPGDVGIGGWNQSGKLTSNGVTEHGTSGVYIFGSQRLWSQHFGEDGSGIIGFMQAGVNNSKTLPVNIYAGAGLSFLGLVPYRKDDSFGIGIAFAKLNHRQLERPRELICQGYYQAKLFGDVYLLSTISYIPNPGLAPNLQPAFAATARIIASF